MILFPLQYTLVVGRYNNKETALFVTECQKKAVCLILLLLFLLSSTSFYLWYHHSPWAPGSKAQSHLRLFLLFHSPVPCISHQILSILSTCHASILFFPLSLLPRLIHGLPYSYHSYYVKVSSFSCVQSSTFQSILYTAVKLIFSKQHFDPVPCLLKENYSDDQHFASLV